MAAFDHFVEVSDIDDGMLAERIQRDGIDILVDLKGYTKGTRVSVLAQRPAPVQVTYLGYPGTLGADFVDYLVTDEVVTPPAEQGDYAERFAFVSGSYQCNDAQRQFDSAPGRAACNLPEDAFVFACFNQQIKIRWSVFEAWTDILRAVPDSVLWLMQGSASWRKKLLARFSDHGISSDRIVFAEHVSHARHLARIQHADLALDTFPVNMHTTASDALWAGVPYVTVPGATFASRVGASLLHAVGLPELIAPDFVAYRQLAIDLARDPERYRELRDRLADLRVSSGLFDGERFARELEDLFDQMWLRFDAGQAPEQIRSAAATGSD